MKHISFGHNSLLLVGLFLTACATRTATPTADLFPTATVIQSQTPSHTPSATVTITPTPSPMPTLPAVSPITTSTGFWITGWSPDGRMLSYRSFTPEDVKKNPYEGTAILPYGTFHLLNVHTNEWCQYPQDNPYALQFNLWHAWLPDGRLMTLNQAGNVVALEVPCDGRTASLLDANSRPPCLVTNSDNNQTCSPDGQRLATTDESRQPHTTTILSTVTGQVEAIISWAYSQGGIGHIGGPFWLDNTRFVIHATDEGPLLVTLDRQVQVQPIASTFFGRPGQISQHATGAMIPDSAQYHLLLQEVASETSSLQAQLYHSESGLVEELGGVCQWVLDTTGRNLL